MYEILDTRLTTYNEKRLIQGSIKGDPLMQKELYFKYMPAMYNRAVRMLSDTELAKDLTQEVFTQVFKDLHRFRGDSTLGAWIKRITINKCLNFLKVERRMSIVPMAENFEKEEEEVPVSEFNVKKVHEAIKTLPQGCRTVFNLYLLEGYQHDEIAQILDISVSTSKTQFRRAKRLLQEQLKSTIYE